MRILITGGTGSLGRALLTHWLRDDAVNWLGCFSRDELKQAELAESLGYPPKIRWLLGDVRNPDRLEQAFRGVDVIVHAAALKRLDSVADNPEEVLATNLDGTRYVIRAASRCGVRRVLLISSDKSTEAWNAYGVSKAAAEHVAVNANRYTAPWGTIVSVIRYGNVLGSRGSVLHRWRAAVAEGRPIGLTDPTHTRFALTLPDAVGLVAATLDFMQGGELVVPVLPSMRMVDLAAAIGGLDYPVQIIGVRPGGEKPAERLLTREEVSRTVGRRSEAVYVVTPMFRPWSTLPYPGEPVDPTLDYTSDRNIWWRSVDDLRVMLKEIP